MLSGFRSLPQATAVGWEVDRKESKGPRCVLSVPVCSSAHHHEDAMHEVMSMQTHSRLGTYCSEILPVPVPVRSQKEIRIGSASNWEIFYPLRLVSA